MKKIATLLICVAVGAFSTLRAEMPLPKIKQSDQTEVVKLATATFEVATVEMENVFIGTAPAATLKANQATVLTRLKDEPGQPLTFNSLVRCKGSPGYFKKSIADNSGNILHVDPGLFN